ncbi:MAG TPA: hypothetical protein DFR83_13455, partial [Deltaproteobacteria bacterium]|nr:hypothetical protein [Deltaproteobacteria bacterium]
MVLRRSEKRLVAVLIIAACDPARVDPVEKHTPTTETHDETFGTSGSCRSCHPDAYSTWSTTYHRTMTQRASPESVLGEWDHVLLERDGREYHLYRESDAFWVDMPKHGTRGDTARDRMQRPIVMTTGSHHMQLYWYAVPWLDKEANFAGRDVFEAACTVCHFSPWEGVEEPMERTFLENRQRTEPWLRSYLGEDPETGPHQKVFAGLRPSEKADLLEFLTRIQHGDRLAQFPFAWFIRQQRWVHEEDSFLAPPQEPLEVEDITEGWSEGCDRCHAVGGAYTWDPSTQTGAAGVTDLGIACEACHGRGAAHATRYRDPFSRYAAHLGFASPDDIIVPDDLPADRSAQVCGQCHAELVPKAGGDYPLNFEAGDDLSSVVHFLRYTSDRPEWLVAHLEDEPDALESGFW